MIQQALIMDERHELKARLKEVGHDGGNNINNKVVMI